MAGESAWIIGMGIVTAVGGCTAQTIASVRAGISCYEDSDIQNKRFEPMTMALIPNNALPSIKDDLLIIPRFTARQLRMLRLGHLALPEAMEALPDDHLNPVPLYLAGPETLPGHSLAIEDSFLNHLAKQSETNLDIEQSRLFATGRAGGMEALQHALQVLQSGEHEYVLLGGIDSYRDLYLLASLDMEDRVLANGIMDGFAPGEGAAFLSLCSNQASKALQRRPVVKLHMPAIAVEQGHRFSEENYTGDGLAEAVAAALEQLEGESVNTVFTSMNGENLGAKEWGVAYSRSSSAINPDFRFEHPADCFGDIGAAAMPVLSGLAAAGMKKGYIAGPALITCSSDGPHRGAVCISTD